MHNLSGISLIKEITYSFAAGKIENNTSCDAIAGRDSICLSGICVMCSKEYLAQDKNYIPMKIDFKLYEALIRPWLETLKNWSA